MTRIRTHCTVCGGIVSFLAEEQQPNWIGMLGFCWCGQPYRLDGGELVELERPQLDESVLDLRDADGPTIDLAARAAVGATDAANVDVVDAVAAHELLGALAAIHGSIELAATGDLDHDTTAALLSSASARMSGVIARVENLVRGLPADATDLDDAPRRDG